MSNTNNDMVENLKRVMGEKQVNDALSQISPEMIENFSKMMNNNNSQSNNNNYNNSNNSSTNDFNIDIDTMMKMKSIIDKLNNNKDDPRSNLLYSLKPYMRESRQENIDKYANLLKMADLVTLLNNENDKKEESHDE